MSADFEKTATSVVEDASRDGLDPLHALIDSLLPLIRQRHGRAIRRTRHVFDLDDLCAELHLRLQIALCRGKFDVRSPHEAEHWVLETAKHAVIDAFRRESSQRRRCRDGVIRDPHLLNADPKMAEAWEEAGAILAQLTDEEVTMLRHSSAGQSQEAIAASNGITLNAQKSRMRRLRQRVREIVQSRGGGGNLLNDLNCVHRAA